MELLTFTITRITKAATDAILVFMEPAGDEPVAYEAGQFLTLVIQRYGKEVRRAYSIASTPGIDAEMFIVIKRQENGEISRYLTDHLKAGDMLTTLHPAGRFTLETSPHPRTVFFIAAGSGITPVYALMKKVLAEENSSQVILIYQNRTEHGTIFKHELETLQHRYGQRMQQVNLLSDPSGKKQHPQRLNNFLLEQLLAQYYHPHALHAFYICGPYAFMRMVQFVLRFSGVRQDAIHKENFVIDAVPPPPLITDQSVKQISLLWKERRYRFEVAYPSTILQAALQHDIKLPYSCRGGRCSSCTVKCISGKVVMSINEVLTGRDLQQGLVLTCVGYAETDLVLEL